MRRLLYGAALAAACALVAVSSAPARALVVAYPGGNQGLERVKQADLIVTGQVLQILDQDIKAAQTKGAAQQVSYRIGVLRVNGTLKGKVKGNLIKVGYIVYNNPNVRPGIGAQPVPPVAGGIRIRPGIGRVPYYGNTQVTQGMDGMFLLTKHHTEQFYTLVPFNGYVSSQNKASYDTQVALTRSALRVVDNPKAGLKSKDAQDRLVAVSLLVDQYRQRYSPKVEAIDAAESKLILKALYEADWDPTKYQYDYRTNPQNLFSRLGINNTHGFMPPQRVQPGQNYNDLYAQAAKDWLKKNMNTFRVQRFVPQPGAQPQPGGGPVRIQPVPGRPIRIQPAIPGKVQQGKIQIQIQQIQGKVQILPAQNLPVQGGGQVQGNPGQPRPEDRVDPNAKKN
jgi:hypothetical protein